MNSSRIEEPMKCTFCSSTETDEKTKNKSVKHQVGKTNHNAQKCANYQKENTIFNIYMQSPTNMTYRRPYRPY